MLMLVANHRGDCEVMVPYQALLMVGQSVHTVCPAAGPEVNRAGGRYVEVVERELGAGEVADVALMLARNGYITGQALNVNGG
jgi:hypothetical protein